MYRRIIDKTPNFGGFAAVYAESGNFPGKLARKIKITKGTT